MELQREYVGIDVHRRRSVIVRRDHDGTTLEMVRIDNDADTLAEVIARCGDHPEVVIESAYGWYWAADVCAEAGATVHLAHPLGNNWGNRRVKNDERDATDLADLLRLGRLAEGWLAPPLTRELRELVRYRAKLVLLRTGLKCQVHAVLAKEGRLPSVGDLFRSGGSEYLDHVELADAYRIRVESLRDLIERYDQEIELMATEIGRLLNDDAGYWAIQEIPGIGPILAAVFVAEIGDVTRFKSPRHLCSWAGLTPRHRESDDKVHRGHITKQGSALVRWAAVEAAVRVHMPAANPVRGHYHRVAARRGTKIARVAAARKILTLVFYGLRDGELRCLAETG